MPHLGLDLLPASLNAFNQGTRKDSYKPSILSGAPCRPPAVDSRHNPLGERDCIRTADSRAGEGRRSQFTSFRAARMLAAIILLFAPGRQETAAILLKIDALP